VWKSKYADWNCKPAVVQKNIPDNEVKEIKAIFIMAKKQKTKKKTFLKFPPLNTGKPPTIDFQELLSEVTQILAEKPGKKKMPPVTKVAGGIDLVQFITGK
jgi:hypothetical protein